MGTAVGTRDWVGSRIVQWVLGHIVQWVLGHIVHTVYLVLGRIVQWGPPAGGAAAEGLGTGSFALIASFESAAAAFVCGAGGHRPRNTAGPV